MKLFRFLIFITENGFKTTNGPTESIPKRRPRHRAPHSEPSYPNKDPDSDTSHLSVLRKPSRAKSQPPGNTNQRTSNRENRRSLIRYDWAERHIETRNRQTPNMRASASAGEVRAGANPNFLYRILMNMSMFVKDKICINYTWREILKCNRKRNLV